VPDAKQVFTVSNVNQYIKALITSDYNLSGICVSGELSNFKKYSSGHAYFSLKDAGGVLKCVMFSSRIATGLKFIPSDGMRVLAYGSISVYERDGVYQLYTERMQLDGVGTLYMAYEALKSRLEQEGLFDPAKKREIPKLPSCVGVVTSASGAVIRDIQNVIGRRFPTMNLKLFPVSVQGENASPEIVRALQYISRTKCCDVVIVGRGGGSIEDLWAFNDENLAYAIYNCKIPVISAVGHETDFTICDFVSDLRAPTPSAAAELAVPDTAELVDYYKSQKQYVSSMATLKLRQEYNALTELKTRLSVVSPQQRIFEYEKSLELCKTKIQHFVQETINKKAADITKTAAKLEGLNPVKILSRGYSIAEKNGKAVNSAKMLKSGDEFTLRFSDGEIKAKATGE